MLIDENHPIWQAIDNGGGQTCDVAAVLRALYVTGYTIVPRGADSVVAKSDEGWLKATEDEGGPSSSVSIWPHTKRS